MKKLRFGLVGAGTHGRGAVIPAFLQTGQCELLAVADHSLDHLEKIRPVPFRMYHSLHQMLENEDLDALYIATLASSHCELALQAFKKGLHVICEKPMASSHEEAQRMVAAAADAGRELFIMFENRFKPHYRKIREWIVSGAIGKVEALHLQSFGKHPAQEPRRANLLNEAGCLDCGIHMLDLARFWTGGGEWQEIYAIGSWFGEEVLYPPHVGILARLDNDVTVTFEDSFSYGRKVAGVPWNFRKNSLTIVGSEGVITESQAGDQHGYQLVSDRRMEHVMVSPSSHREEIHEVLDYAASVLRGAVEDRGWLATGHDGLAAQHIVEEVNQQSAKRRRESRCPI